MRQNPTNSLLLVSLLALNAPVLRAESEHDLIATLRSTAGVVEKCAACQTLRLAGTADAVPALGALLSDQRLSQAARYALEGIPAPEAATALREAVARTSGLLRAGVVDSLGWKRDAAAIPLILPLLSDSDATVCTAAAAALGRIGGREALSALVAARDGARPDVRPTVVEGILGCAELLLEANQTAEATAIYESLAGPGEADHVRIAAHIGLIRCAGTEALTAIQSALQGGDVAAQTAALQVAAGSPELDIAAIAARLLTQSPPALQIALLGLLQNRGNLSVLPTVQVAVQSPDPGVRRAAFAALAELGDPSAIPSLAEAAASGDAADRKAARQALASLHRGDVTGQLVARLQSSPPGVQVGLIRALTTRGDTTAVPALLQFARDGQPATRSGAFQALNQLADATHFEALVQLLAAARDADERGEVAGVFESISERLADTPKSDFSPITRGLSDGTLEVRLSLLRVAALFIHDDLRTALRAALADNDDRVRTAARRALCSARDPALLPDLLKVARETPDETLHPLAVQAIVRLATDETAGLSAEQRTETLSSAFELARRVDEKRQVLSGLTRVPNTTTLALARRALEDPAVKAEAGAALVQLTQKLRSFSGPFIQDWHVCGPYRKTGATGATAVFDIPFGPEIQGEKIEWKAAPRGDVVNLGSLFPGQESCVAYLKAGLVATDSCDAILLMGSDDGVKAWLNGTVVHENNVDRGESPDQDMAPVRLVKGKNELLLKITQGGGGWVARARLVTVDGQAVPGLRVLPTSGSAVASP